MRFQEISCGSGFFFFPDFFFFQLQFTLQMLVLGESRAMGTHGRSAVSVAGTQPIEPSPGWLFNGKLG